VVLRQGVQQPQQRGNGLLEGLVQREYLPRHLGADGAGLIAVLHMRIALEQVQHRHIGGGLAVGHRGALQHPPALGAVRVDHLVHEAGLAHPGLTHGGHHLTVPRSGPFHRLVQGRQLGLPAHKAREPAGHGRL
jgi:hypothetical protein